MTTDAGAQRHHRAEKKATEPTQNHVTLDGLMEALRRSHPATEVGNGTGLQETVMQHNISSVPDPCK